MESGGFIDLSLGSYIEGSTKFGGIQPDYLLDAHPDLISFLNEVKKAATTSTMIRWLEKLGLEKQVRIKKIELVTALIQKALPLRDYGSKPYLEILEEHRLKGVEISLGSYLACEAGVCRENALLTHLALKAVGIPNKFVYVQVQTKSRREDHAIVVIEDNREKWIVDPYNRTYHGKNLEDMMDPNALITPPKRTAKYASPSDFVGQILQINSYPKYWIPKPLCNNIFI
ncbi:MAG: hypothetical protein ACXWRU_16945 [Pseudobdellovibrionaceae bacterium]